MSAFMCSNKHINVIVKALMNGKDVVTITHDDKAHFFTYSQVGKILTEANRESMLARYRVKPVGSFRKLKLIPFIGNSPVQILKYCHCFDYQACEYDGWDKSIANALLNQCIELQNAKLPPYDDVHELVGYLDAKWEL